MRIKKLLVVPLLALFVTGCIKDDLSECRPEKNVTLWFTHSGGTNGSRFVDYIGEVDLFLFDDNGKYLSHQSVEYTELAVDAPFVSLTLSPGTYYALAWGNVGDNSAYQNLTVGVTSLEECLVEINPAVTHSGDPVYYAPRKARLEEGDTRSVADMALYELVVPNRGSAEKTLDFVRAHRSIYVWIRGFTDTDGLSPTVEAERLWSRYDFHYRTRLHRRDFVQQTRFQTVDDKHYAVAVFHHAYGEIDDEMNVLVLRTSNGEQSAAVNVRRFLEENPVSSTDDVHIMFTFIQDLGVSVSLPQWVEKPVRPGID